MQITVRLFATLRQLAGWKEKRVELPAQTTVAELMEQLAAEHPSLNLLGRTLYAAVNMEYTQPDRLLADGDEVAFFPPVSGGAMTQKKLFEITAQPLSLDEVAARVSQANCGAITTFAGVVRGETVTQTGPRGTDFLNYEAYSAMAERMLAQIGEEIQRQWPKVAAVSILHRIGRCEIGEPSVVIAVATPHRGDGCFEACRYAIERLKAIVPIWKEENWADGQVWVEGPREPALALTNQ